MKDAKQLIDDPGYLAYKIDFATESVEFIPLAEDDLSNATWLARDALGKGGSSILVPLLEIVKVLNLEPVISYRPPRFIFHTAYCASTYLSRCLAVKGLSVSLREPQLILDAANAKRLQWRSQTCKVDFRHLPKLALRLLRKHATPQETLIIKPINSANNIISELLHASGASKSVMLYTDARNFLLSTLKKGEEARQRQRAMFDLLRCDFPHLSQLSVSDVIHMSDLKLCLSLWRLQLEQAEQAIIAVPSSNGSIRSVYAETLIKEPEWVINRANEFLELDIPRARVNSIVRGELSIRDAKNSDRSFSLGERDAAYQKIEEFFGVDLDNAYQWLTRNNPTTSLTPVLSASL